MIKPSYLGISVKIPGVSGGHSQGVRWTAVPGGGWGLGELHLRWLSQVAGELVLAEGGWEELI